MPTTADAALYAVLNAHVGLGALIGTADSMRCYPVEAPQTAALPLLIYECVKGRPATTHGEGGTDGRLDGVRYQLTALAATALQAKGVLHQARLAIEASALKAVCVDPERSIPRAEEAKSHGAASDFHFWNNPDA